MKLVQLILCFGVAASSAHAGPRPLPENPAAKDVQLMHDYSRCIARHRTARARELLAMDYRTKAYAVALRRLVHSDHECTPPGELAFQSVVFVGGLAEELLERDLNGAHLASRVAHDPSKSPLQARDEGEFAGLCTARTAPGEVARLLKSEPATKSEQEAVQAVQSAMRACLPNGSKARFNAVGLRSLLALGAYRLSAHNMPTQIAGN